MAKPANLVFAAEIERVALAQLEYARDICRARAGVQLREQTGMYLAKLGTPVRLVDFPPTPKENCRNCGAPPEIEHLHACRWCLTPY